MSNVLDVTSQEQRIAERVNPDITKMLAISDRAGGVQFANAEQVTEFAKMMAVSQIGVRKHLRGNVGACLAIVVQSVEWGVSPFAVANKSYLVNDQIAFESQLVQAVILKRAPIKGRIHFRFEGDGDNRICFASATLADGTGDVEYESPRFGKIQPKNSPLWKNDPDQQHCYYSGRALCRRHFPDVLLGIYAEDEFIADVPVHDPQHARDVTPRTLTSRLDALSVAPAREETTSSARGADASEAVDEDDDGLNADGAVTTDPVPPKADPEKIALIEKLRPKAKRGTDALRRALSAISEAEEALLTDADHDALGALAEQADAGGKAA